MKIILSPNPYRDKGMKAAIRAQRILEKGGIETVMCLPFNPDPGRGGEPPEHLRFANMAKELPKADMLVCFGGDGTILHAARDTYRYNTPILGVNLGSVGFIAELEQAELEKLSQIAQGDYTLEKRMMLDVVAYHGDKVLVKDVALNDAVVTKGAIARVIDLTVFGDGVPIYNYSGDGVVLSTPTGSTAYSISAGGPIVEPTSESIIVTPICAHSLSAKPLVTGRDRVVTVEISPMMSNKYAYLSVDGGRAVKLSGRDRVVVRRSNRFTQLVRLTRRSFYELVDQKLGGA